MKKHWLYLKYVLRHKRFVYEEGRKLGLGRVQLLVHDLQKFLPSEWFPYVEMFYGPLTKPGPSDFLKSPVRWKVQEDFDRAWLHHQKLGGKHHWQYWVLREDDGTTKVLEMPDKYRREMLADWRGAGRAIHGKDECQEWYLKSRQTRLLHPKTKAWVEGQLGAMPEVE